MQGVLDVPEVGEDADVFVGNIVAVRVADNGEIRCIRDPQIFAMPGEALDAIEAGGEGADLIRHSVTIGVFEDDDAVPRR